MVIVKIQAGLGNQMFSYACAWTLQQKTGERVYAVYDKEGNKTGRKLSLSNTGAELFPQCPKWLEISVYKWKKWEQRIKKRDLTRYADTIKAFEDGFCCTSVRRYIDADMTRARVKYLSGTFQSKKYFEQIDSVYSREHLYKIHQEHKYSVMIKELFKIQTPSNFANKEMQKLIMNTSYSICLHIRLGDYKWEKFKRFQVCTEKYYKDAVIRMIDELRTRVDPKNCNPNPTANNKNNKPCFFVFSEDQDVVKTWKLEEICNDKASLVYVNLDNPDYEELRLMYSCDHFIISNSTFSWWAQYLSDNDNKIVIAPNRWLNGEEDNPVDLYEDDWICIEPY